jgi:hypothetical protein
LSSVEFDTYFPFDAGPGANTGRARWRQMGRLWLASGVVKGVTTEMNPNFWDAAAQVFHIAPGAVWVDGFYGEATVGKAVPTPGNDGLVVARLRPDTNDIILEWRPGARIGDELQDPIGWWDVPLFEIWPDGRWADRRRFVSPEPFVGLAEVPPWVPRGHLWTWPAPDTLVDAGDGHGILGTYLSWTPGWVAGRHIRVSARATPQAFSLAGDPGQRWHLDLVVTQHPSGPEWARLVVVDSNAGSPVLPGSAGWTSVVLPNAPDCLIQLISFGPGGRVVRYAPNSCFAEISDMGV